MAYIFRNSAWSFETARSSVNSNKRLNKKSLRGSKEIAENQEAKLKKVRALKGHVEQKG